MAGEPRDGIEQELRLMRELYAQHMQEMSDVRRGYRIANSQLLQVVRENREFMRENREFMRENREATREHTRVIGELREMTRELREETKAHRKAILALLDRLEGWGGPEPATG